mmetsp:Transcript_18844/g.30930  ORF Transcript_18844/g.30930 Transcript_18844/m.30930 type:complete len:86 (+) Transcript_18844:1358-1615(+)
MAASPHTPTPCPPSCFLTLCTSAVTCAMCTRHLVCTHFQSNLQITAVACNMDRQDNIGDMAILRSLQTHVSILSAPDKSGFGDVV